MTSGYLKLITLNNIDVTYKSKLHHIFALSKINLTIFNNQFISLIGPSGCGKTSLINLIAGLIKHENGEIYFNDKLMTKKGKSISIVFQDDLLLPWRNVDKNIRLPLELLGLHSKKEMSDQVKNLLDIVDLEQLSKLYPASLSGGQKQRVNLARALASDPHILLMDEPFASLDEFNRFKLNLYIQKIFMETGKTIIFVTHSVEEAVFLSDRVVILSASPGSISKDITIDFKRPRTKSTTTLYKYFKYVSDIRNTIGL